MKVVILESLGISRDYLEKKEAPFKEKGVEFAEFERTADTSRLIDEAKDADAVIIANMPFPGEVISGCNKLKFIDIAFTGVDHVDINTAKANGIKVSNASGYSNEAVAELALGMVLSSLRNLRQVEDRCRAGQTKDGLIGSEIKGKTVGIVGLGKIGSRTAEIFNALGAKIVACNRRQIQSAPDYISPVTMDELLALSDIIILHCPLNDSTRGMFDAEKFSKMKRSAILVNVARGPVVNTADLADALNNNTIAAAAIDVFDKEPPLSADEPLLHCKNILVTPHVAFATKESMILRADIVFDNLKAWMEGNQINTVI